MSENALLAVVVICITSSCMFFGGTPDIQDALIHHWMVCK